MVSRFLRPSFPLFLFLVVVAALVPASRVDADPFDPARAPFVLRVDGTIVPYRVFSAFVLPGERLIIDAGLEGANPTLSIRAAAGTLMGTGPRSWTWQAPEHPGIVAIEATQASPAAEMHLNVLVMVPARQVRDGVLNGYRLDPYPSDLYLNLEAYAPPRGFVEVTRDNLQAPLSPHFRLGQFIAKQASDYPKYVVLRPALLTKLEAVLEGVNQQGHRTDTLDVMSGYRTPFYNRSIGNGSHSRHIYGDAADIFVDVQPQDGRMDDLDRNGRSDFGDTQVLFDLVERLERAPVLRWLVGGLSRYRATSTHGPFVHVDARGHVARW